MPLQSSISPLLSNRRSTLAINGLIESMRGTSPQVAQAFTEVQSAIAIIERAMRQGQSLDSLSIVDPNGVPLAYIGPFIVGGVGYSGACFSRVWIGPGADPTLAPFFCDGFTTVIGKNGVVQVQDAGGNQAATLGITSGITQTITGATNASPSVITIAGHGYVTGDTVHIPNATGNTAINGYRIVVRVDADTFSLTDLNGTAINGNGALTNTPSCTIYWAGVLAQTLAIGAGVLGWTNYKLRAFANGDLRIANAQIDLSGTLSSISLNPTTGTLTVTDVVSTPHRRTTIASGQITVDYDATNLTKTTINSGEILLTQGGTDLYGDTLQMGLASYRGFTTEARSEMLSMFGYAGSTAYGPRLALFHSRGEGSTPSKTLTGDQVGGVVGYGMEEVGGVASMEGSYAAAIRFLAAEDHDAATDHGVDIVLEGCAIGSATPTEVIRIHDGNVGVLNSNPTYALDVTGDVNMSGVPRIGGTAGIDKSTTRLTGITVTTATLQYKDHAGVNQTMTVVTNVGSSTVTDTFTKGIITA